MTSELWTGAAAGALLVAKSLTLLTLGYCATKPLSRAPAAARHVAWLAAIVGVLLVPVFDRFTPVPLHVLPPTAVVRMPTFSLDMSSSITLPMTLSELAIPPATRATPRAVNAMRRFGIGDTVVAIWAIVAVVLAIRLIVGLATVARLVGRARALTSFEWRRSLETAANQLAVTATPRLVMSDEVDMAFTFNVFSPAIVLPRSANEWSPERRQSVLLHELAHIRRRDLIGHALAGFACILNWFDPCIWIAARQLRIESERACDDVVLGTGMRPSVYAQHLLDMATSVGRRAPSVALAMARPKEFEGRLVAILDPVGKRAAFARRQGVAIASLLAIGAVSIGAVAPVPRGAAPRADESLNVPAVLLHRDSAFVERRGVLAAREAQRRADHVAQFTAKPPSKATIAAASAGESNAPVTMAPTAAAVAAQRLSSASVAMLLRYGTSGIMNPMMMLLRESDSLRLSGAQADSIATLNRLYRVRLSSLWQTVSAYYASRPETPDERSINDDAFALRETTALLLDLLPAVNGVLTPEQHAHVTATTARYLDAHEVESIVAMSPTGVFVPESQLFRMFGRGRGGG